MSATEELIDRIVEASHMPSSRRRGDLQRELRAHIEDFVAAALEQGAAREEVERLALARFGDAAQIADGFAYVYRHERAARRLLGFVISTMVLAGLLSVGVFAIQAGITFGSGGTILNLLTSHHSAIEALDILASVAAYLALLSFKSLSQASRMQKVALLLVAIATVAIFSATSAGFLLFGVINGLFFRAIRMGIASELTRLAVVAICFPSTGLVLMSQRMTLATGDIAAITASWLITGIGYLIATRFASSVRESIEGAIP